MSRQTFDVVIVGAGLVGSVMALLLSKAKFNVALVDKTAPKLAAIKPPGLLTSTLTYHSIQCLNQLGVWKLLTPQQKTSFTKMCVWEQEAWSQRIEFNSLNLHYPFLGAVVYNSDLLLVLHQQLAQQSHCQWITDSPKWFESTNKQINLMLEKSGRMTSQVLIGADGAQSWIKKQLGCLTDTKEYGQQALVGMIKTEKSLQQTAWQVFSASGPAALLPCGTHQASLVWSQYDEQANALYSLDKYDFSQQLMQLFGGHLGTLTCTSALMRASLVRRHAKQYSQQRVVLIGDAVRTIHPLAGQGLNLGLLDVMKLGSVLMNARDKQRDIGSD